MRNVLFILMAATVICGVTFAERTVVREVVGLGATRDEAIKDALYQAVAQTMGVGIDSGAYHFGYRSATADIDRDETTKKVEFDAVSVDVGGSTLSTDVSGLVKTYEILEEGKGDDDKYTVKLKVWIFDYESPDNTKRVRLAIMPIRPLKEAFLFGIKRRGDDIAAQLSQKLSSGLAATNKFMVLDREYLGELEKEERLLRRDGSIEEKAKLGEALGGDYILTGTISDALLIMTTRELPAIGRNVREYKGRFVFDYRVLGGATKHIRKADTVELVLETEDVKALYEKWEPDKIDVQELGDRIISTAAKLAVEAIVKDFYPIRVAAVNPAGQIIIDQGSKRLSEGMLLDVYAEGEDIIDSDTGESLGKAEVQVATIQVESVSPKIAFAKVVDGDLAKISEGFVCKSRPVGEQLPKGRRSRIEKTTDGGVKMPFD